MDSRPKTPNYNYYYSPVGHAPGQQSPVSPKRRKNRGRKRALLLIVVAVVAGGTVYALSNDGKTTANHVASKVVPVVKQPTQTAPAPNPNLISDAKLSTMGDAINNVISQNSGIDMSVSLIDLNSGQTEHYGTSDAFTAASTTKVITAVDFLHEVENGQQSLNESIGGATAEHELQQMIVVSDDNAWDELNETLGYPQLQAYAHSVGATSFLTEPNNTVTSDDMALMLKKLWEGDLLNQSDTQLLLGWMKEANYREYVVPAIPSSDTIYHKIGLYEDNVHDEAIVTDGDKAFVIAIFTNGNGTYDWPARATMMQQITKAALTAFF